MAELATLGGLRSPAFQPALAVEPDPSGLGWGVRAYNLDPDLVASVAASLESVLRVTVANADTADHDDLPDLAGEWEIVDGEVRFLPDIPFEPGVPLRAILDLGAFGQPGLGGILTHEFSFPREAPEAEPEVSQAFPSGDVLPENLLRFYVRFSRPMRRGCAEANIEVLGPDGRQAPDVLYRAPVELWDPSMTCLTVLLDPGRLKRGVGPNRLLGPPLKIGARYTLAVRRGMMDLHGRPLRQGFSKSFVVSDAVRASIAVGAWKIVAPALGSRGPLELRFPRPLDWAQLWQGIAVASEHGERMRGRVAIDQGETRWCFTPDSPWGAGSYRVCVSPDLEDACGNTPYGAFDGPVRSTDDIALETAVRSIPFEVKAACGRSGRPATVPGAGN